ncbi:MAG: hypothetical protein KDB47_01420 [Mycobacterium sp.]|nr:hypothetical protein [Mycobacterium sp.]
MTFRVDRTLPHHAALGLVLYTQPRRRPTLDDRTLGQIQRDADTAGSPAREHTHLHRRGSR